MSNQLIFYLPGNETMAKSLSNKLNYPLGKAEIRRFPDEESYIRIDENVKNKDTFIVCTLNKPDEKLLPLYFLCSALKEFDARRVMLIAPYLAYMRQDKSFKTGEAVTSGMFAKLLSKTVDKIITIDPHLHRLSKLDEIYSIPTIVLHAAPLLSHWVKRNVQNAFLVGPDEESGQWVSEIAKDAGVPFTVLTKERISDTEVSITMPDLRPYKNLQPVMVDDIISTAHTMIEGMKKIRAAGLKTPICLGVHGIFAGNARSLLEETGAQIITTNSIYSPTSGIDISGLIADALK